MTEKSPNSHYRHIFYFLGHLPAQMNHALALYKELPGECIVTTKEAQNQLSQMGIESTKLDAIEKINLRTNFSDIPKTLEYLNKQTGVIFFFDTFTDIAKLTSLTKVMLFHGNTIKLRWFRPWRIRSIRQFDHITSLGPFFENILTTRGIPKEKIVAIGQTRCDEIIKHPLSEISREKVLKRALGSPKKIISYLPTWYGTTSVQDIGPRIAENISNEYLLLIRPHPETPKWITDQYLAFDAKFSNILYVPEGKYPELDLVTLLQASDAFILDMSSVLLDTILMNKPILFAFGGGAIARFFQSTRYKPVQEILNISQIITRKNVTSINDLIKKSFTEKRSAQAYKSVQERFFYNLDGNSIPDLVNFIVSHLGRISE